MVLEKAGASQIGLARGNGQHGLETSPLIFSQNHAELQPASKFTWFQDRLPCKAPFIMPLKRKKKTNKMKSNRKTFAKKFVRIYVYIYIYTYYFSNQRKRNPGKKSGIPTSKR